MRHRSSSGLSFQAIGLVLADQGDLPGASKMFQQALAIEKDIGEKSNYAETLREMGRVWMQQGKLDQARKSFDEALSGQEQLGEMGSAAETRLALGELACNSGRANEAEQFARAALKVFQAQNEPHEQILAAILLSRSLIEQGKLKDAAAALEVPLKLAEKNSDLPTRLSLMVADANVVGASNDLVRAGRVARRVLAEAPRDLFRLRLEASLSLGEIQCKGKNVAQGRERLQEVARAAKEKGFELIVRKALAAGGW
jgi:tetratricopeptide (TPR) repeat protein